MLLYVLALKQSAAGVAAENETGIAARTELNENGALFSHSGARWELKNLEERYFEIGAKNTDRSRRPPRAPQARAHWGGSGGFSSLENFEN